MALNVSWHFVAYKTRFPKPMSVLKDLSSHFQRQASPSTVANFDLSSGIKPSMDEARCTKLFRVLLVTDLQPTVFCWQSAPFSLSLPYLLLYITVVHIRWEWSVGSLVLSIRMLSVDYSTPLTHWEHRLEITHGIRSSIHTDVRHFPLVEEILVRSICAAVDKVWKHWSLQGLYMAGIKLACCTDTSKRMSKVFSVLANVFSDDGTRPQVSVRNLSTNSWLVRSEGRIGTGRGVR